MDGLCGHNNFKTSLPSWSICALGGGVDPLRELLPLFHGLRATERTPLKAYPSLSPVAMMCQRRSVKGGKQDRSSYPAFMSATERPPMQWWPETFKDCTEGSLTFSRFVHQRQEEKPCPFHTKGNRIPRNPGPPQESVAAHRSTGAPLGHVNLLARSVFWHDSRAGFVTKSQTPCQPQRCELDLSTVLRWLVLSLSSPLPNVLRWLVFPLSSPLPTVLRWLVFSLSILVFGGRSVRLYPRSTVKLNLLNEDSRHDNESGSSGYYTHIIMTIGPR
jgi:hypothetical protein